MKISIECPMCHNSLEGETEWCGQTAQCPYCQNEFVIPETPPEPPLKHKRNLRWLYVSFAVIAILCISTWVILYYVFSARDAKEQLDVSDAKNAKEQFDLGIRYYDEGNYPEAVKLFREAAEQGERSAQFNLGMCYARGHGVPEDWEQAVYWYRKSADQGVPDAQCALGMCYYLGSGVSKDYETAVYWLREAAEQGVPMAQYGLGVCYLYGHGVPQVRKPAVYWFRKAAEQGVDKAQKALEILGY